MREISKEYAMHLLKNAEPKRYNDDALLMASDEYSFLIWNWGTVEIGKLDAKGAMHKVYKCYDHAFAVMYEQITEYLKAM